MTMFCLARDMTYLDLLSQGQRLCQLNKFDDALPVLEKALYKVRIFKIFTDYIVAFTWHVFLKDLYNVSVPSKYLL